MDAPTVARAETRGSEGAGAPRISRFLTSAEDGAGRGGAWRSVVVTSAELAECSCPEACLRDHANE